ncbi:uncharacterized protein LOC110241012 isoform X6 [Exaiptasia diaphana]|uniref:Uncharacterized protein n=1 Tax=Exaiptasia diaphana TaxID=2652724 RepID=A0A913YJE1_EXADI|nr:uncharacterized protein LOC110241012 isoform X6 [Exaiptasia diaphana]
MACIDSPKFRVDVIFNSLKELEREKELLESRLAEQKRKCKALEEQVEAAHVKCITAGERMIRMKDNVDVAKQKMSRTSEQAKKLEQLNEEKRYVISQLNQSIKDVNQKQIEETESLKDQLSDLAEKFRNARNYYKDEALQSEISRWEETEGDYKTEAYQHIAAIKDLNDHLENLKIEGDQIKGQYLL